MLKDEELELIFEAWHSKSCRVGNHPSKILERQAYFAGYRAKERADDYTTDVVRRVQAIIDKTFGPDETIRILPFK